jgi:hypothetical protein
VSRRPPPPTPPHTRDEPRVCVLPRCPVCSSKAPSLPYPRLSRALSPASVHTLQHQGHSLLLPSESPPALRRPPVHLGVPVHALQLPHRTPRGLRQDGAAASRDGAATNGSPHARHAGLRRCVNLGLWVCEQTSFIPRLSPFLPARLHAPRVSVRLCCGCAPCPVAAPGAAPPTAAAQQPATAPPPAAQQPDVAESPCPVCTYNNPVTRNFCEMCENKLR